MPQHGRALILSAADRGEHCQVAGVDAEVLNASGTKIGCAELLSSDGTGTSTSRYCRSGSAWGNAGLFVAWGRDRTL